LNRNVSATEIVIVENQNVFFEVSHNQTISKEHTWLGLLYLKENTKLVTYNDKASLSCQQNFSSAHRDLIDAWKVLDDAGVDDLVRKNIDEVEFVDDYIKTSNKTKIQVTSEINTQGYTAWKLANGVGKTGIKVIDDFLALAPKIDNIAPSNIPTGYQVVTKNNSKYIRRLDASNTNTPRLMVDETGTIVQYIKPTRLSSNGVLRNRLKQANGGTLPDGHQAHHIVSDNVVQNSSIHQEAINRGLYDIDRTSNGKLLAETAEDYPKDLTGASEAYPTHFGSHPQYDDAIRSQIDDLIDVNDVDIFNLENLSDTEIQNLVNAIENRALNVLANWQPSKLN